MLRILILLSCATVSCVTVCFAAGIEQTERDFGKALAANDFAVLDKALSPDLVYTHATGNSDTKAAYLDSLKTGKQRYNLFEYQTLESKSFGDDTAIVYFTVHVKSVTKGTPSESHLKVIHVWSKQNGTWQLVAHQSTRLPD